MNEVTTTPKGPLALLVHPVNRRDLTIRTNDTSHKLHHFVYDPTGPRLSRLRNKRKRRKNRNAQLQTQTQPQHGHDAEEQQKYNVEIEHKLYHPNNGEFTLAFFCEMNCRHSQRVAMVLAKFMHAAEKKQHDEGKRTVQLICIPNDEMNNMDGRITHKDEQVSSETMAGEANLFTHLYSHSEFWHMGFDHGNRSAIIAMLSVAVVPSLIVINNRTGRIVTSWGMEALESALDGDSGNGGGCETILDEWREGRSGVPFSTKVIHGCTIF